MSHQTKRTFQKGYHLPADGRSPPGLVSGQCFSENKGVLDNTWGWTVLR